MEKKQGKTIREVLIPTVCWCCSTTIPIGQNMKWDKVVGQHICLNCCERQRQAREERRARFMKQIESVDVKKLQAECQRKAEAQDRKEMGDGQEDSHTRILKIGRTEQCW